MAVQIGKKFASFWLPNGLNIPMSHSFSILKKSGESANTECETKDEANFIEM